MLFYSQKKLENNDEGLRKEISRLLNAKKIIFYRENFIIVKTGIGQAEKTKKEGLLKMSRSTLIPLLTSGNIGKLKRMVKEGYEHGKIHESRVLSGSPKETI